MNCLKIQNVLTVMKIDRVGGVLCEKLKQFKKFGFCLPIPPIGTYFEIEKREKRKTLEHNALGIENTHTRV